MPDASYFAEKSRRCRELNWRAANPEIAEQLRLWADEFDAMAAAMSMASPRPARGIRKVLPLGELEASGLRRAMIKNTE